MEIKNLLIVFMLACMPVSSAQAGRYVFMGYCPGYCLDRISAEQVRDLTHLIYCAVIPGPDGSIKAGRLARDKQKLASIKEKTSAQLLLAAGGEKSGDAFLAMAENSRARELFTGKIMALCRDYGFAGIVIDWEYPEGQAEKKYCAVLVTGLAQQCKSRGMVLAVTAPGKLALPGVVYDAVDYIHVMSYDHAGMHATFEHAVSDVNFHLHAGASAGKLCLGIPLYARSYTGKPRVMTYAALVRRYRPHIAKDNVNGMYFNNMATVRKKVMLCKEKGLAGVMIWQVAYDSRDRKRSVIAGIGLMLNGK